MAICTHACTVPATTLALGVNSHKSFRAGKQTNKHAKTQKNAHTQNTYIDICVQIDINTGHVSTQTWVKTGRKTNKKHTQTNTRHKQKTIKHMNKNK